MGSLKTEIAKLELNDNDVIVIRYGPDQEIKYNPELDEIGQFLNRRILVIPHNTDIGAISYVQFKEVVSKLEGELK